MELDLRDLLTFISTEEGHTCVFDYVENGEWKYLDRCMICGRGLTREEYIDRATKLLVRLDMKPADYIGALSLAPVEGIDGALSLPSVRVQGGGKGSGLR